MAEKVLLSLEEVSLSFGGKPLFEDLSLHILERDRVCIVGRNGVGKTTLMRLITGDLQPDTGKKFSLPGIRVGYLAQQVDFSPTETVKGFVLSGLPVAEQGEHSHYLADMVMAPLELIPTALMGQLSGGQVRRAALAQALVADPDILLLDEPTNHLDLTGIEWLENYLAGFRGALVCISHDRAFLANVSKKVFWLDRGTLRTCPKGYADFDAWAEEILEIEARTLHNMQKKLEQEEAWTQGGVTARRKRNQRRMAELFRLREKLKNDRAAYNQMMRGVEVDPLQPTLASKIIAEFKGVGKTFTRDDVTTPILQNFSLRIIRGDRIGILGRNGSGKSTFLKLLTGQLEPDTGRVTRGKNTEFTYFDQNRTDLNPNKTLWETLCPEGNDHVFLGTGENRRARHVCAYLKDFLFDPKIARDKVGTLSGGQQNRLMLAKVLAAPGNVLILDEPTNDLDMDTLDMLQELLADYPGTLLLVSHDRDFLDRTVTKVLAFEGNAKVEGHIGGYSDYIAATTGQPVKRAVNTAPVAASAKSPEPVKPSAPAKMSFKLKHELETLPGKLQACEADIATLKTKLADPSFYMKDPEGFDAAAARLARLETEREQMETRWLELEEIREGLSA